MAIDNHKMAIDNHKMAIDNHKIQGNKAISQSR